MQYFLLFHGNNSYANALQYHVYTHIVSLVYVLPTQYQRLVSSKFGPRKAKFTTQVTIKNYCKSACTKHFFCAKLFQQEELSKLYVLLRTQNRFIVIAPYMYCTPSHYIHCVP